MVEVQGEKIATATQKEGFKLGAEGIFQVIGILENIKNNELKKLEEIARVKK
jgi:hypothetical protein